MIGKTGNEKSARVRAPLFVACMCAHTQHAEFFFSKQAFLYISQSAIVGEAKARRRQSHSTRPITSMRTRARLEDSPFARTTTSPRPDPRRSRPAAHAMKQATMSRGSAEARGDTVSHTEATGGGGGTSSVRLPTLAAAAASRSSSSSLSTRPRESAVEHRRERRGEHQRLPTSTSLPSLAPRVRQSRPGAGVTSRSPAPRAPQRAFDDQRTRIRPASSDSTAQHDETDQSEITRGTLNEQEQPMQGTREALAPDWVSASPAPTALLEVEADAHPAPPPPRVQPSTPTPPVSPVPALGSCSSQPQTPASPQPPMAPPPPLQPTSQLQQPPLQSSPPPTSQSHELWPSLPALPQLSTLHRDDTETAIDKAPSMADDATDTRAAFLKDAPQHYLKLATRSGQTSRRARLLLQLEGLMQLATLPEEGAWEARLSRQLRGALVTPPADDVGVRTSVHGVRRRGVLLRKQRRRGRPRGRKRGSHALLHTRRQTRRWLGAPLPLPPPPPRGGSARTLRGCKRCTGMARGRGITSFTRARARAAVAHLATTLRIKTKLATLRRGRESSAATSAARRRRPALHIDCTRRLAHMPPVGHGLHLATSMGDKPTPTHFRVQQVCLCSARAAAALVSRRPLTMSP